MYNRFGPQCLSELTSKSGGLFRDDLAYIQDSTVVKSSVPALERYDQEVHALEVIHQDGVFPGVVRLLPFDNDPEAIGILTAPIEDSKADSFTIERRKARFVTGSTGEGLLMAKSVLDILKTLFDVIEVHRALVMRRNVLHRDIGIHNILLYPKHSPTAMNNKKLIDNPPVFIQQILDADQDSGVDKSFGLLIGFDHSAQFFVKNGDNLLKQQTGTPMFIARSVAQARLLGEAVDQHYYQMPRLNENARRLYDTAFGSEEYQRFCDEGSGTAHGVSSRPLGEGDDDDDDDEGSTLATFYHRPEHDVESIFWVLMYTLIQANPSNPSEEVDEQSQNTYWLILDYFRHHQIHDSDGPILCGRDRILLFSKEQIARSLHPNLRSLAGMLRKMIRQINPEYSHLSKDLKPVHLHEAMRRILLNQIVKMEKDPIPLQPGKPRPGPSNVVHTT